ncbi:hypothetical protein GUITHDRAFT_147005 [Guillardia theta CCMP2712]|uniref:Methyltransferase small domain-containing protein n=1 Tax=Guillardia theta (strain CCMP2712) TaxID=905079 RepID=L1IFR4_GUITC|nr:hypothetical protein GUITHDRAFT_147005 [Guillardia theta CCMP2712]EKX34680.1 hypothetical protein GUITHDRAFT_147005 [Guillardia theta CCMP2712]|eukprot:XP_005821660.1 hypothetical protein GUITHDRAFT_147005 [Guillardia theta CCMP2712]
MGHGEREQDHEVWGTRMKLREQDRHVRREDPTSARVWPASSFLAQQLQTLVGLDGFRGKRVLELGSGTGLLGMAVAAQGGCVTMTDMPYTIVLIDQNVELNSHLFAACNRPRTVPFAWGRDTCYTGGDGTYLYKIPGCR